MKYIFSIVCNGKKQAMKVLKTLDKNPSIAWGGGDRPSEYVGWENLDSFKKTGYVSFELERSKKDEWTISYCTEIEWYIDEIIHSPHPTQIIYLTDRS